MTGSALLEELFHHAVTFPGAGREGRVCIMCAESNPADCHRSFIADWLAAQGHRIIHLLDSGRQQEHPGRLI